jgi:hypothetical protein
MQINHVSPQQVRSGAMVKVQIQGFFGLYWHFGIVSDQRDWLGVPYVISNSSAHGGVREEAWEDSPAAKTSASSAFSVRSNRLK